MKTNSFIIICFFILVPDLLFSQTEIKYFPELTGPYLGQKPPGSIPEIFAPGVICSGLSERDVAITPDANEFFFGLAYMGNATIMVTRYKDGKWTEPEIAPFATDSKFACYEPSLNADGNRIFFLTNRPTKGKEPKSGWFYQNIWASDRKPDGSWSDPYDIGTEINGNNYQYFPSLTKEGTLYFTRLLKQGDKPAIYRSRFINGKYSEPEKLPAKVNQSGELYNAFISPDESYLIACVDKRQNKINPGKANYLVFFRDKNDNWSDGIDLGPEINTTGTNAMSPYVTPDGKYFFFATQKKDPKYISTKKRTLTGIIELCNSPQNGNYDIYWVDAKIIEKLKPKAPW
jgi:hypothetical protein